MPSGSVGTMGLVEATLDVEEPTGWVRVVGMLQVSLEEGREVARCMGLTATDEAGVVLPLSPEDRDEFARRLEGAYQRRGGRGVYKS